MNASAAEFVFLRPLWLVALAALPLLVWLQRRWHRDRDAWQRAVDPHLLPHLLATDGGRAGHGASVALALGAALAIAALAGPSWRQLPARLWQQEAPLVIALDLSSAVRATDLPPSRLVQARYKLASLLEQRRGGQVGLLAYAGDAFDVAPITRDARTVRALLDSLTPDLMPVDGQRADRAIVRAVAMLRSAGFDRGDILLLTDHADVAAQAAAVRARSEGFRVSALGVGTATGGPVTGQQGFVTGSDGQVQFARLDASSLAALAQAGGGRAASLTPDGSDLAALGVLDPQGNAAEASGPADSTDYSLSKSDAGMQRSDDGYWLVLALLPLGLFAFRRRGLAMLPIAAMLGALASAPMADAAAASGPDDTPATATSAPGAFDWDALWQRDDQRARAALDGGDPARARALAPDPALRGAAAYRGEDYPAAAEAWSAGDGADTHYNRGNALAMAGRLDDALAAYDAALAQAPGMPDAVANRKAVEDLLKQQQQQAQDQQSKDQQSKDQQSKDQQSQNQQSKEQQSKEQQSPDQQSQDQQSQDQQSPSEAAAEAAAKEAARQEMQQALERNAEAQPGEDSPEHKAAERAAADMSPEARAEAERRQALQQWLRRVPDDPGGLLRRKFELEYRRRQAQGDGP